MADLIPKVTCTYCQEDINGVRVQCCECPDFDICLQCFPAGAEIGAHKNDHSYKFVDHTSASIFGGRGSWTGLEQLQLLDAATLYSYRNWELVSVIVASRTADECREEYTARYLDGNIGKATWANVPKPNLIINLAEDDGPLSPLAISKLAPLDATLEETKMLGYKPHRDDFEREYDPEAEQLVANLRMGEKDETDVEKALKLAIMDMYIRRLRERHRRKRIVRDYQLVAKYFDNLRRNPSQPLYPKEQKALRDHMRPFAQFLNAGEHDRLIASVERERELRHRLSELKRYRSLGLTTQDEIVHYEQHMAFQRQQIKQGKVATSGSGMQVGSVAPYIKTDMECGVETVRNSTDARITWPYGNDSGCDSAAAAGATSNHGRPTTSWDVEEPHGTSTSIWAPMSSTTMPSAATSPCPTKSSVEAATVEAPPDLRDLPAGRLLSREELELCTTLNMQPMNYVTVKALIILENLHNTGKQHQTALKPDPDIVAETTDTVDEITKFVADNGWLPGHVYTHKQQQQQQQQQQPSSLGENVDYFAHIKPEDDKLFFH